ncbi:TIGR03619 family F420-dependent LLM class oxidoreductase [Trujillonella endophytica]|uniref:Probable F420-dependent oxidoreductase, Rv2161c family n=1 Tax=Trujillonella endophytica TaxID=673521 RepID=A0A1H8RTN7_9ACTN|nr:TIGR03619 family F420-dependent LLM class oxidoreductase [Trujillella endophytica]SEO69705.1 probable F420-dependent oxidoreductase, Rv2161c family [Trujillella endophytica]
MTAASSGVGVLFRATADTDLLGLARAAEERGFDAFALGEHTHIPVDSDETQFPGGTDQIPQSYARLLDPYISLAYVAATTSMKVGTATSLPAEHDPIALAKALATLDHLSGGRLVLGVGYGWNSAEMHNHGRDFADRRAMVREIVELMRELWANEVAEYHGKHFSLAPSWSWPEPVGGSVPVLLGAAGGAVAMEQLVQWADGWMPGGPAGWIAGKLAELRARWTDAGRGEPGPVVWAIQGIEDTDKARKNLEILRGAGVAQALLAFDTTDPEEVLPVLDRYSTFIA